MLAPRPWTALPTGAANLWEGRRKQLAAVEMGGGSVASANFGATAVQPAVSQGLQLDFLKERDEVNRVHNRGANTPFGLRTLRRLPPSVRS